MRCDDEEVDDVADDESEDDDCDDELVYGGKNA